MNAKITKTMQKKIKQFLSDWKETESDDMFSIEDYHDWMESAVDLLREVIGEEEEDNE